jgi:cysteine desulfurase/selenocysteine lyase
MNPFLYGGDMIAEGQVTPEKVNYNVLPWKFAAGTPNILGAILSAEALRLLIDFSLNPGTYKYFMTGKKLEREDVKRAMDNVESHEKALIGRALEILSKESALKIYGPKDPADRTSLVAFTCEGKLPFKIAEELSDMGVESRAGCHCATLAHHFYGLTPPASCRLSFYIYNDMADVERACEGVKKCINCKNKKSNFDFIKKIFNK